MPDLQASPAPQTPQGTPHERVRGAGSPLSVWLWRAVKLSVALSGVLVVAYAGWLGYSFAKFQHDIYRPLPPTPTATVVPVSVQASPGVQAGGGLPAPTPTPDLIRALPAGRFNILVLGTDKRPDDPDHYPRSDTILLVNVDTVSSTVRIMTIPRDLVVDVPGYGKNKVNAAYMFGEYYHEPGGGQALAVRTISEYFGVPIDYYVTVNFEGFRRVIDTLGGVYINVPYSIDDYNYPADDEGNPFGTIHVHFDAGWQYMDGKQALRYARTRHADNDFMRSRRQLQIIMAARERAISLDLVPRLPVLIEQLGGMIETNIPFDRQVALTRFAYSVEPSHIFTYTIDSSMILPTTLPDGSEGLRLNRAEAQPVLDEFFGMDMSHAAALQAPSAKRNPTPTTTPAPGTKGRPKATPGTTGPRGTPTARTPTPTNISTVRASPPTRIATATRTPAAGP